MYNNQYLYNPQPSIDRINAQINELQKMKDNMQQPIQPAPTSLTQNFQLAPNNHTMRFADTIDEVNKEPVYIDTPFFSRDMSIVWIKNTKGDIKTYELNEIIPQDSKDIQIAYLQEQLNELKGMIKNDANVTNVNAEQTTTNAPTDDEPIRTTIKKDKPSSIQKVSRSKEK